MPQQYLNPVSLNMTKEMQVSVTASDYSTFFDIRLDDNNRGHKPKLGQMTGKA